MKIFNCLCFLFLAASCSTPSSKPHLLKGELVFLLQYNNRLPSDVGFLTNHIMERRMANLMKQDYEPFINSVQKESPLRVDSVNHVIVSAYSSAYGRQVVIVDVENDALWVDYKKTDTLLHFADRTSLKKPE